jgi:UDP-glucose:(heptosyl)LPS alpha-1,3-glucosyltransferase
MKIGYAYVEYGITGGIERASFELASAMANRGHEVHYHCTRSRALPPPGVTLHHVFAPGPVNAVRLATFAWRASRALSTGGYNITHSHGDLIGAQVVTAHSCHTAGLRYMARIGQDLPPASRNFGVADKIRLHIERQNFAQKRYRAIIAVSSGVQAELGEAYDVPGADVTVIPNGVDLLRFPPGLRESRRLQVRTRLGLPENSLLLLFVGNEFHRKGLGEVIRALKLVSHRDAVLVVAGGDDARPYSRLAADLGIDSQVRFVGKIADMDDFYQAADIFVLPSAYEAFSVAMLEAAGAGLPLVLSRVNGAEEFLKDGVNGLFVERNPKTLAEAINRLLADANLRARLGAEAGRTASDYTWDHIASRVEAVYHEVLGRSQTTGRMS